MPGSKKKNPFDSETPSRGQRVDALGERLSELRTKLGGLLDGGAESGRVSALPDPPPESQEPSEDDKLALLVFNTVKGDSRRLRLFVQRLARLEAAAANKTKVDEKP